MMGLLVLFGACTSEESPASEASCAEMRDHLIELRLRDAQGAVPHVDVAAHRAALSKALGDGFVESCHSTLTIAQARCALDARNSTAAAACSSRSKK
jgi:hypothetical protein